MGSAKDFDFLIGTWDGHNRRLVERLVGSTEWEEFPSTSVSRSIFGGNGNMDEIDFPTRGSAGLTIRLYDADRDEWSLHWVSSLSSTIDPPVVGRFDGDRGEFYCDDTHNGKPVRVRYIWSGITATTVKWEQALSPDGGQTWETNWIMDFTRTS
jgi:hypothetical protein